MSWLPLERIQILDRFLTNNTRIQLKVLCREPSYNAAVTQQQIKNKLYKLDKTVKDTKIEIHGRIGRVIGCLPSQPEAFLSLTSTTTTTTQGEKSSPRDIWQYYYNQLWRQMEKKTFKAYQMDCDYSGAHLYIDEYSNIIPPEIPSNRDNQFRQQNSQSKEKKKNRRTVDDDNKSSPLANGVRSSLGTLLSWGDGYYFIEINSPQIGPSDNQIGLDVDVIISMKNRHDGYLTADEYPALVFYGVMCAIYALFALLWFIWCALYWRELLQIQFWIAGVILIGMIEKSAFVAEYDTLNRNGYKVYYAIMTAEVFSCLKRSVSRMLVIIVALGYGIIKPRLGSLKQKVFATGILYFTIATTESILRLNSKHDETNNKVLISRLPLAIVDAIIYYWIFTALVATTRTLRLRKNLLKLNVYRHFTNTILFAIISSLLFMIWSLKSHFFTACITNWGQFWIDDAFWHLLFSVILLVIMFLFRPSNNNQRYAFVPLLDLSDNDEFSDGDEEKGESTVFDSIKIRKMSNTEMGTTGKSKKQQQSLANREGNVSNNSGNANCGSAGTVEDALTWVENNLPTSLADQALQALDNEDEIINIKLERSKMQ